jgi:hypothetical protein
MKICETEGCSERVFSKKMCSSHYYKLYYLKRKYLRGDEPKVKKDKNKIKEIIITNCMFCGKEFIKTRKDKKCCDVKCLRKLYVRGSSYQPGTKESMRGEVMLVLTKWKWKMADELLVFRTIHLYLLLCGSCEEHIMSKSIDKVIPHCLRELKALYFPKSS